MGGFGQEATLAIAQFPGNDHGSPWTSRNRLFRCGVLHFIEEDEEKTNRGWMFTFLGAGLDAFAQAEDFGIGPSHALRAGRDESREAFRASADKSVRYMAKGVASDYLERRDKVIQNASLKPRMRI